MSRIGEELRGGSGRQERTEKWRTRKVMTGASRWSVKTVMGRGAQRGPKLESGASEKWLYHCATMKLERSPMSLT